MQSNWMSGFSVSTKTLLVSWSVAGISTLNLSYSTMGQDSIHLTTKVGNSIRANKSTV